MSLIQSRESSLPRVPRLVCVLATCLALISCGKTYASPAIPSQTMMAAVRGYSRISEPPRPATKAPLAAQKAPSPQTPLETESEYEHRIVGLLSRAEYDQLEQAARDDRQSKGRVVGGVWRLFAFYDAVTNPSTYPHETDADWSAHIEIIKRWNSLQPESATARIALAGSYINFAWFARGQGYSDTVSQNGWDLFAERFQLAKGILLEAARLKDRCPYWFELMQMTALAEGWDKPLAKEIFEKASAFEPTYYHFYREYANYLQPKWYGEEGEAETFAEQISDHVGSDDGDIIYFEIASLLACQCQSTKAPLEGVSWPRVQRGYIALRRYYGVSNLKLNRFALMAYSSDDKLDANQALAAIGQDWDHTVWRNQQTFENAKTWAASQ
jgi:hypothetical protein